MHFDKRGRNTFLCLYQRTGKIFIEVVGGTGIEPVASTV